ncbi:MAG: hypothetical protein JWM44_1547, partial [Bacilli bacterium]|nr:hypothetical protein [Bacilli bacterium]
MRKTKIIAICLLGMLMILTSCDGTKGERTNTAANTPNSTRAASIAAPSLAGPVNIAAYAYPSDRTEDNATLEAKIKRFMAKNPNVTITPKYWKYENTEIAIKMASNSAQTECTTWATEGKLLSAKKWITDLSENLASWPYTKDLNE